MDPVGRIPAAGRSRSSLRCGLVEVVGRRRRGRARPRGAVGRRGRRRSGLGRGRSEVGLSVVPVGGGY